MMPTYQYNPAPADLLTGKIDYAILVKGGQYIAWSRTREAPARHDFTAACADTRDMLSADGFCRLSKVLGRWMAKAEHNQR